LVNVQPHGHIDLDRFRRGQIDRGGTAAQAAGAEQKAGQGSRARPKMKMTRRKIHG